MKLKGKWHWQEPHKVHISTWRSKIIKQQRCDVLEQPRLFERLFTTNDKNIHQRAAYVVMSLSFKLQKLYESNKSSRSGSLQRAIYSISIKQLNVTGSSREWCQSFHWTWKLKPIATFMGKILAPHSVVESQDLCTMLFPFFCSHYKT